MGPNSRWLIGSGALGGCESRCRLAIEIFCIGIPLYSGQQDSRMPPIIRHFCNDRLLGPRSPHRSSDTPCPFDQTPAASIRADALRGLMLVLMTVTHLPTRLSSPLANWLAASAAELCAAVGLHGRLARAASAGQVSTPCGWLFLAARLRNFYPRRYFSVHATDCGGSRRTIRCCKPDAVFTGGTGRAHWLAWCCRTANRR
jgi:hypothetical protein